MRTKVSLIIMMCAVALSHDLRAGESPVSTTDPSVETSATIAPVASWLRVEVNIPARELRLYDHDRLVQAYPVAIGQLAYKSIVMNDEITKIEWNPWWYPPNSPWAKGAKVTPPGPGNPLGPVKMPLGQGIRIHGTNKDGRVGRATSHGCFRMHNKDAMALAWYLQTQLSDKKDPALLETYTKHRGTTYIVTLPQAVPVNIVYEPVVVSNDVLYIYPDVYGKIHNWYERIVAALTAKGIDASQLAQQRIDDLRRELKKGNIEIPLQDLFRAPTPTASLSPVDARGQQISLSK